MDRENVGHPRPHIKMKKEHRVPLSDRAMAVLREMGGPDSKGYIFPGAKRGEPLSTMAMLMLLRRMGQNDITVHGFRSTFKDWASERTSYPREVSEMSLAHAIEDKVEAAYRRGELLDKRRRLMAEWARFCGEVKVPVADNVRQLRGA
jgi:integrase